MTDDTLNAIEARAAAATEGPWLPSFGDCVYAQSYNQDPIVTCHEWPSERDAMNNSAFIAAARSDVPTLVAEVKRLRALTEHAPASYDALRSIAERLVSEARHYGPRFDVADAMVFLEEARALGAKERP